MPKSAETFQISLIKTECAERLAKYSYGETIYVDEFFRALETVFHIDSAQKVNRKQAEETGIDAYYERRFERKPNGSPYFSDGAVKLLPQIENMELFLFPPSLLEQNIGLGMFSEIITANFVHPYVFDELQRRLDSSRLRCSFRRFYSFKSFELTEKEFASGIREVVKAKSVYHEFMLLEAQEREKLEKKAKDMWDKIASRYTP